MMIRLAYCIFLLTFVFSPSYVQCKLVFSKKPVTVLSGYKSKLKRPEGVTFTPDGEYLLIANAGNNSLAAFQREGISGAKYSKRPAWEFKSDEYLHYVHDLCFNQSGDYLGAVCRENNMVVLFQRNDTENGSFNLDRVWHMCGTPNALNNPSGLAFSPFNDLLSVVNRMGGNGINFYKPFDSDRGIYETYPTQQILEEESLPFGLAAPHAVAFSHDGQYLAVLHKKFFKNKEAEGVSALVLYEMDGDFPNGYISEPEIIAEMGDHCLHSIDIHPSDRYIAVTFEEGYVLIFERVGDGAEYQLTQETPHYQRTRKAKGVAFSSQGDCLAITFQNNLVIVFGVTEE